MKRFLIGLSGVILIAAGIIMTYVGSGYTFTLTGGAWYYAIIVVLIGFGGIVVAIAANG